MKKSFAKLSVLMVVLSALLGACVFNEPVATNQVAVWSNGGKLEGCVGPGVYTGDILNAFQELIQVSADTMALEFSDPEVATSDNQLVGLAVSMQVRRATDDCEAIKRMLERFPALKEDTNAVQNLLIPLVAEGMKNGVRAYTLDSLLSDRNGLSQAIQDSVETDLKQYSLVVVGVQIKNVDISDDYAKILNERANLTAERDKLIRQQEVIKQTSANAQFEQEQLAITLAKQLEAEKAKTAIEVEIAKREGEKTAASQQVYSLNPQAYELEKLRLMAALFNKGTVYFIPTGTTLSTFLGGLTAPIIQPTP